MSEVRGVILDFYGVIREDIQACWLRQNGLERRGEFARASDELDAGRIGIEQYLEIYAAASGIPARDIRTAFESTPFVNGMQDFVPMLARKGLKLGLLSNADSAPRRFLDQHNLLQHFDDVVISSEVGIRKPDPNIYHLALGRLGLKPHETIFVDDSTTNIEAARHIGMRTIFFESQVLLQQQIQRLGL